MVKVFEDRAIDEEDGGPSNSLVVAVQQTRKQLDLRNDSSICGYQVRYGQFDRVIQRVVLMIGALVRCSASSRIPDTYPDAQRYGSRKGKEVFRNSSSRH